MWIDLGEVPFPCLNQDACENGGTVMLWMYASNVKISSRDSWTTTGITFDYYYTDLYVNICLFITLPKASSYDAFDNYLFRGIGYILQILTILFPPFHMLGPKH